MQLSSGDGLSILGPYDDYRKTKFVGRKVEFRFDDGEMISGRITKIEATIESVSVHGLYDDNLGNFQLFFDRLRESQGTPDYYRWFLVEVNGRWLENARVGNLRLLN